MTTRAAYHFLSLFYRGNVGEYQIGLSETP